MAYRGEVSPPFLWEKTNFILVRKGYQKLLEEMEGEEYDFILVLSTELNKKGKDTPFGGI